MGEASGFVEEYFQNVGEKNCQSFMFRQYIVMDGYLCVSTFLEQLGLDMGRLPRTVGYGKGNLRTVVPWTC